MMTSRQIRILPLLIVVAMLAFSVRIADVATGVSSSIGGSAFAASEKKEDAHAKDDHAEEEAAKPPEMEIPKQITLNNDAKKPPPMEGSEEGVESSEETDEEAKEDWRHSIDDELEYGTVKQEVFEDLSERRQALEKFEKSLTTREALLKAAEQELDRKYQELSALRVKIEGLLKQQSEEEEARVTSLVKIYEGMKPKDAARIFDTLDLDILVVVMSKMSERKLSPILAAMNAERARTITIMLAEQKQLPQLPM